MRRTVISIIAILVLSSIVDLHAATLAGVTLPDAVQAGNTKLVLNGLGVRTKFVVKVYVAGLYLPQKSSDPAAILKPEVPKRIVMHFLHDAGKNQITDAFNDSFNDNAPEIRKTLQAAVARFMAGLEPVKRGDEMVFTYVPGAGTSYALNGSEKLTISDPAFGALLFSVWLGPKPPNASLKKGLLGQ